MKSIKVWSTVLTILVLSGLFAGITFFRVLGQENTPSSVVQVGEVVTPSLSPVMRDVAYVPPEPLLNREEINPIKNPGLYLPDFGLTGTDTKDKDPLVALGLSPFAAPSPILNFEGQGDFNMYSPPDTTGDVGPNHFVQMVNVNTAVYDKSGNLLAQWANNQLWAGFGGPCQNDNSGDPIVLYDDLADRWLLTQFAISSGQMQCFAVSTTPDPTGSYYRYAWTTPDFPDYPKIGVWPDGYYMGTNTGYPNQYYAHVFDRNSMLAGSPAGYVYVGGQGNFLMPNDADGSLPPPAGAPGVFYTFFDGGYPNHPAGVDRISLFEFDVDWATPSNSTFTLVQEFPIANFNYTTCGFFIRNCLQQLGTSNRLDAVDPWPMVRFQYRNLGSYQAMVGNFTVDVTGSDQAGIRWFELRNQGAGWSLYQEGTYAPDTHNRFMGSIAMDGSGNLGLGYSITSATMYPSIRYTVHANGDGLGTMQTEAELFAGGGSQTSSQRWGDYSGMNIDPADNCTFWITNMYHDVTDAGYSWNTRIGTFRVPGCTGGLGFMGTLAGTVTDAGDSSPIEGAEIAASLTSTITYGTTTDEDGGYSMIVSDGTYEVTASAYGYLPSTVAGVVVMSGTVTTEDFALAPAAMYEVSGYVTDVNTGWPLYAVITIDGYPGDPVWTDPVSGYYAVELAEGITYTFDVEAFYPGYLPESREVGPLTADATEDFALDVDNAICIAPGYGRTPAYEEDFEADNGGLTVSGTTSWAWGTPSSGPGAAHSGVNVWATNLAGNYNNGEDGYITSPVIDLSAYAGQGGLLFNWWQWLQTENGWDYVSIGVSNNGGATWTLIYGELSGTIDMAWTPHSASLSDAYAVNNFQYRFRLRSDGSVVYPGWYVDDVSITLTSCEPGTGGLVVGNVYDDNTTLPLVGALVEAASGETAVTMVTPDDDAVDDGFYYMYVAAGTQNFTALMEGYGSDVASVTVISGDTVGQDFLLTAGWLTYTPSGLAVTLEMFQTDALTLTITNDGGLPADFELVELDKGMDPLKLGRFDVPTVVVDPAYQSAKTAEKVGVEFPAIVAAPFAAGDVLQSWMPGENSSPWGIAFDGDGTVWVGDGWGDDTIYQYEADGTYTGVSYPFTWGPANGPADAAFNWNTGMLWSMDVAGDDCIHEIDPASGVTGNTICPAFSTSMRGVAYDPATDTWFAGSWNDGMVHHFDASGAFLDEVNVGLAISGLAYNPETMHLFVMVNSSPNPVYVLDAADDYNLVGQFNVSAGFADYGGAGLEFDCEGNLWAVDQNTATVYQFESGETANLCSSDVPWLSESPITGTLAAAGSVDITVGFDAGQVAEPGVYYAQLKIKENTPYSLVNVPITMTVTPPGELGLLEGMIESLGYCDDDPAPLEGAVVTIEDTDGVTYTVETDELGYYYRWLVEDGSPYIVTVSAADHQDPATQVITITGQSTVTLDYSLRWLEPCITADPTAYEVTVGWGYTQTHSLDINNAGAGGSLFELVEKNLGSSPAMKISIPAFEGVVNHSSASTGQAPGGSHAGMPSGIALPNGTLAYSVENSNSYFTAFDLDVPEVLPSIAVFSSAGFPGAGEYINDYVYVLDSSNNLYQLDPATGAVLSTVVVAAPPGSETYTGLALDPTSGDVYAASCDITTSSLFLVDVEAGTSTRIGAISNSPCTIGIAIDGSGVLYGYDLVTDMFLTIDKETGAGTEVGSIGFDANFGQGMGWDPETDTLYMAAFNGGTFAAELRVVDRTTGNTALVGVLGQTTPGGTCQLGFLAIPISMDMDIPWLSEEPISGTVAADGSTTSVLSFGAGTDVITQTGTYSGQLTLKTDDPVNGKIIIPVVMHVVAPAYGVDVSGPQEVTAGPGDVITFTVNVTNTGNGPMDTYTLTITGTYAAVAPIEVGPLAMGETAEVQVVVTVPSGAADGDVGTVVLTATSQGDDTVSDSTTLTVNVEVVITEIKLFLPVVFKIFTP